MARSSGSDELKAICILHDLLCDLHVESALASEVSARIGVPSKFNSHRIGQLFRNNETYVKAVGELGRQGRGVRLYAVTFEGLDLLKRRGCL